MRKQKKIKKRRKRECEELSNERYDFSLNLDSIGPNTSPGLDSSPVVYNRRQVLRKKISDSNFADDILQDARNRVRSQTSAEFRSSFPKITVSRHGSDDISDEVILRSRSSTDTSDIRKSSNNNSTSSMDEVAQELVLGILSGNALHVKEYISLFESKDCAEIQTILRQMSNSSSSLK